MLVLGISGGRDLAYEDSKVLDFNAILHDSSAVLVDDGKIVAAMEEERFNRERNTGKAPINAIKYCLDIYGVSLQDVDKIVYSMSEIEADIAAVNNRIINKHFKEGKARSWLIELLQKAFKVNISPDKLCFVDHDICHASSAYYLSGFDKSLILNLSGSAFDKTVPPLGSGGQILGAEGNSFSVLQDINITNSLGVYYLSVMQFLGLFRNDEYKVMELAQYGDSSKYEKILRKTYTLLPDGKFTINLIYCDMLYDYIKPRRKGEIFTQDHKDLAAALQEALIKIVKHILEYYKRITGYTKLCIAGGMANNYIMNGKVLASGLFEEVFVHPAAYNAGNAIGGALYISKQLNSDLKIEKLQHVNWGTSISDNNTIYHILDKWSEFLSFSEENDIESKAAKLLEKGFVIGWMQGNTEFGCNALGNRNILANPTKGEIRETINQMLKDDDACRPIALSILEEDVDEYFELTKSKAQLSYMNFTLLTKHDKIDILRPAIYKDGSARIQTVSKVANKRYWGVIDKFKELTGLPILLSTPLNNSVEPIVNTEEDAIACLLTTNIDYLIIGNYLVKKRNIEEVDFMNVVLTRAINSELKKSISYSSNGDKDIKYEIRFISLNNYKLKITENSFNILKGCNNEKTLYNLFVENNIKDNEKKEVLDEILKLWAFRIIILRPLNA